MRRPELGDKVKDQVSGYTGIVVAQTSWLYGCRRMGVCSQRTKDGKPLEQWFDEDQLVVVKARAVQPRTPADPSGGSREPVSRPEGGPR